MHLSSSLRIPDQLEQARVAGQLVVFAGAGVSIDPPSNLMDFRDLAIEIAGGVPPFDETTDEGHLDAYLERAKGRGVEVDARAREILKRRLASHAPIHEHLLGIFGSAERVRLITTNFDPYFGDAARKMWPVPLRMYVGPSLPPGRKFQGIIQLHGSLEELQDSLVLTKSDFGAAYMTDGWAARFLVGALAERTILFVGYSLGDPVLQYLIGALRMTDRWYAFCREREARHWAEHGVTPIPFAPRTVDDVYGDLHASLERWSWYAQAAPSDHHQELLRLIAAGPAPSPVTGDYIRTRLRTEPGRATFLNAAVSVAWFTWVASEGLLDPLLTTERAPIEYWLWSKWLVAHFCNGESPPLIQFIRTRSLRIHAYLRYEIAGHLSRVQPLPSRAVLRQLIALIINDADMGPTGFDNDVWLLARLIRESCTEESFALLTSLTRVRLEPIEQLQAQFGAVIVDIPETQDKPRPAMLANRLRTRSAPDELMHILENAGSELAALDPDTLVELGERRIADAYRLLSLARSGDEDPDWMSIERIAIAISDRDRDRGTPDVMVALVRLGLDEWRASAPTNLLAFAQRHVTSSSALLRRLSLYALAVHDQSGADALLSQATAEKWARDLSVRPELYQLLRAHFQRAKEESRAAFVDALTNDAWWGSDVEERERTRFNLSRLLLRLCPSSPSVQAFAAAMQAAHSDWLEEDEDSYVRRTMVTWGDQRPSPIRAEELLRQAPPDALASIQAQLRREPATDGLAPPLYGAVQQALRANPSWGVDVFLLASADTSCTDDFLEGMVWGLSEADCTQSDQERVVHRLGTWTWPLMITRALGSLADRWSGRARDGTPISLLDSLDTVADIIYRRGHEVPALILNKVSWTDQAINHPCGLAALTWWQVANARDRIDGTFVLTIDEAERVRWSRVLTDDTQAGGYARAILGMASERLSRGDFPWARDSLFPWFDPGRGIEKSAQLWDGRLAQQGWSRNTLAGLDPILKAFFAVSGTLVPERAAELGDWIALIISLPDDNARSGERVRQFVRGAASEARRSFASKLPAHVSNLTSDQRRDLWIQVLQPYWHDRRTNVPLPLDGDEVVGMVEWVIGLPEVANDVLIELRQTHVGKPGISRPERIIINWNQDSTWVSQHPADAAGVIQWLAKEQWLPDWILPEALAHLQTALKADATTRPSILSAAEALASVPYPPAADFAARIRSS